MFFRTSIMALVAVGLTLAASARTFRVEKTINPASATTTNTVTIPSDIDWGMLDSVALVPPARSTGTVSIATSMLGKPYVLPTSYAMTNATAVQVVSVFTPRRLLTENGITNNTSFPVFGDVSVIIAKTGTSTNGWGVILFIKGD